MSPEKETNDVNNEIEKNLPLFNIYDSEYSRKIAPENSGLFLASKSTTSNSSNDTTILNEYDEDDEEDFIKIYFASGSVLKPSNEPYNLRSKINQANQELAKDNENTFSNTPGKVKFDNTVLILDSFEDIGTVSIGTERLQGIDIFPVENDVKEKDILTKVDLLRNEEVILDKVDLIRNDEDDQNDVVCSTTERTLDTDTTDDKMYSSTSFSRSFSFESDDPMFINVIESGDEFKTIMNRNNKTRQGSAIDEHVTYFPELFTHTQYKMYENCGKTLDDSIDDVNIYVPKKLNAEELRNKLKEISKVRKKVVTNEKKVEKPVKKVSSFTQNFQKKIKHTKTFERRIPPQPQPQPIKPRMTYYFELDPKGKLKPLNKNNISETNLNNKSTKFFHINLKATNNDENSKPRITKTPNTDLFLEFQTDKSGNKGAKLVIKKKPTEEYTASSMAGAKKSVSTERPRLPGYNGLRSEYGLSAEQLLERQNKKMERERRRKELKQKKHEEEQKKRVENEKNFYKWLQQKKQLKKPVKTTRHSYPMNRLTVSSARTSLNCIHNSSQRKGSFALEELLKINDEKNRWFKI